MRTSVASNASRVDVGDRFERRGSSSWLVKYLRRLGDREGDLDSPQYSALKREEGLKTIGFIAGTLLVMKRIQGNIIVAFERSNE